MRCPRNLGLLGHLRRYDVSNGHKAEINQQRPAH